MCDRKRDLRIGSACIHHISEYLNAATKNGFELVELNEWFDEEQINEIPRRIGIVLRKKGLRATMYCAKKV